MPIATNSFGKDLQQFARAVDIVDDRTWKTFESLVTNYVLREFDMEYFEFMAEDEVNDERGLRTQWISEGSARSKSIREPTGSWNGQTAMAFDLGKPMWIVRRDKGQLGPDVATSEFEDLWSEIAEIPPYTATITGIHTSIIVPVRSGSRVLGVLDFEDGTYRRFNAVARDELTRLADAVAITYELHRANTTQQHGTKTALGDLEAVLSTRRFPTSLSRPQIFFACGKAADPEVTGAIKAVLVEFEDFMRVKDWSRSSAGGNITAHTLQDIATSRFGICYFSEPAPEGAQHPFVDNPNVIFEAGMLHAFTNTAAEAPTEWIPIREDPDYTDVPPFDFAQERIIEVKRGERAAGATTGAGPLKTQDFKTELRERLTRLVREP
jgi:hypothetical protein